jgi:hypothetical protein
MYIVQIVKDYSATTVATSNDLEIAKSMGMNVHNELAQEFPHKKDRNYIITVRGNGISLDLVE